MKLTALNSRESGPGWSPGRDIVLCASGRDFTVTVPLSNQVYKWVRANLISNVPLGLSDADFTLPKVKAGRNNPTRAKHIT